MTIEQLVFIADTLQDARSNCESELKLAKFKNMVGTILYIETILIPNLEKAYGIVKEEYYKKKSNSGT